MTKRELIEKLAELADDTEVFVADDSGNVWPIEEIVNTDVGSETECAAIVIN